MSRRIEFRAWSIEHKYMQTFDSHKSGILYAAGEFTVNSGYDSYDEPTFEEHTGKDWIIMQYTGLTDRHGVDIYENDVLNICFTSESGAHIHDGIYVASIDTFRGLNFSFKKLLWESSGYNQFPWLMDLNESNKLGDIYSITKEGRFLYVGDDYDPNPADEKVFPFNQEKELSFCSRYFEVIGSTYQNPELLK